MKKLFKNPAYVILAICFLLGFVVKTFGETLAGTPEEVSTTFWADLYGGFLAFANLINWTYVVCFMLVCWVINDFADAQNSAKWLSWLSHLPRILRAFGIGIVLIAIFFYLFDYHGRNDVKCMFFSLIASLVIYKVGIDKILSLISKKIFGISFEKTPDFI